MRFVGRNKPAQQNRPNKGQDEGYQESQEQDEWTAWSVNCDSRLDTLEQELYRFQEKIQSDLNSFYGHVKATNSKVTSLVAQLASMVEDQTSSNKGVVMATLKSQEEALRRQDTELRGLRVAVQALVGRHMKTSGPVGEHGVHSPRRYKAEPLDPGILDGRTVAGLENGGLKLDDTSIGEDVPSPVFQDVARGDESLALDSLSRAAADELNMRDSTGCTLLHRAAVKGMTDVCRGLLDHPEFLEVNEVDFYGRSPLHQAALAGHAEVCTVLLGHFKYKIIDGKAFHGRTALHCAAEYGHEKAASTILNHPKFHESRACDDSGHSALHHGAMNGHANVCALLLKDDRSGKVNVKDETGWTALHWSASQGHADVCRVILDSDNFTEGHAKTPRGWHALHYAAAYNRVSVVHVLLRHPRFTDANARDVMERTVLHIAAEAGHGDVVRAILKYPSFSAVEAMDSNGNTALAVAVGDAKAALQAVAMLWKRLQPI